MRKLSICKVWGNDYPWDVRAAKVAGALTDAGHSVNMVARNKAWLPVVEQLPEATVYRLAPWRWLPQPVDAMLTFPAFFSPRWYRAIMDVARRTRADLVLCRDLPLAITSIVAARKLGIPMVFDLAENYPAMVRSRWAAGRMGFIDAFVRNPVAVEKVEDWVLPRVDGVLAVVEESAQRIEGKGVPRDKISIVCNTPPISRLNAGAADQGESDRLEVVYLGILELVRGLNTLLDAVAILASEGLPLRLTIWGDGKDGEIIRAHARSHGLSSEHVDFRGRVDNAFALEQLTQAHVGVVPHWKNPSWDSTISNKIFDYMAAGLAVVTSNTIPSERMVNETGCGRVFQDRDPESLAAVLRELSHMPARREAAQNARLAIRERYNWEVDTRRMIELLESVAQAA